MLSIQQITYAHPGKPLLFDGISLNVNTHDKIALIGSNGTGKSTLFKLISGQLEAHMGQIKTSVEPYYIPQVFGQYKNLTVAEAIGIGTKLKALDEILNGVVNETNLQLLNDDWSIEERYLAAFDFWDLPNINPNQLMGTLSGGQQTKIFLSGIR